MDAFSRKLKTKIRKFKSSKIYKQVLVGASVLVGGIIVVIGFQNCSGQGFQTMDQINRSSEAAMMGAPCLFGSGKVANGARIKGYKSSAPEAGKSCEDSANVRELTCFNGALIGQNEFPNPTCSAAQVQNSNPCANFAGSGKPDIANGGTLTVYKSTNATQSQNCSSLSVVLTCKNGAYQTPTGAAASLSSYFPECTEMQSSCLDFDGNSIAHNSSITAYEVSSVQLPTTCVSKKYTLTCKNGQFQNSTGAVVSLSQYSKSCSETSAPSPTPTPTLAPSESPSGTSPATSTSCIFDGKTFQNEETVVAYPAASVVGGAQAFNSFSSCYNGAEFGICKNGVIKQLNYVSANLNLSGKHSSCVQQNASLACRMIELDQANETFGIQILAVPATSDVNQSGSYFLYGVQNSMSFSTRLTEAPKLVTNVGDLFINSLNAYELPQNKIEIVSGMTTEADTAGLFEKVSDFKIRSSPVQGQPFTNYSYKTWNGTQIVIGYGLGSSKTAAVNEMKSKYRRVSCGVLPSPPAKCPSGTQNYGTCSFNYPAGNDKATLSMANQQFPEVILTGTCSGQTWTNVSVKDDKNLCKGYCPSGVHNEGSFCSFNYPVAWPDGSVSKVTTTAPGGVTATLEGQCVKDATGAASWSSIKITNADACWEYCDAIAGRIYSGTTPDFSLCAVDLPKARLGTVSILKDTGVLHTGGSVKVTCTKDPVSLKPMWVPSDADDGSSSKCRITLL